MGIAKSIEEVLERTIASHNETTIPIHNEIWVMTKEHLRDVGDAPRSDRDPVMKVALRTRCETIVGSITEIQVVAGHAVDPLSSPPQNDSGSTPTNLADVGGNTGLSFIVFPTTHSTGSLTFLSSHSME